MHTAYVVFAALTLTCCLFSAAVDFARWERVGVAMDSVGVPRSWMPWLGVPKAAAVLGLLAGFRVPLLGVAAAAGLVLFFAAAVVIHLRARDRALGPQHLFLALATGTLVLGTAA